MGGVPSLSVSEGCLRFFISSLICSITSEIFRGEEDLFKGDKGELWT